MMRKKKMDRVVCRPKERKKPTIFPQKERESSPAELRQRRRVSCCISERERKGGNFILVVREKLALFK